MREEPDEPDDGVVVYRQHRYAPPPGATVVLLVRHGESAPGRLDRPFPTVEGHNDPPLAPAGETQAVRLAERLRSAPVRGVYVTPLRRTAQTAAPLAEALALTPRVEPRLREIHLGDYEGVAFRKLTADDDPIVARMRGRRRWDAVPGAEADEDFAARVAAGLRAVVARHTGETVVAVVHSAVIAQCVALATGASPFAFLGVDNTSITRIDVGADGLRLRGFNDASHLVPATGT